MLIAYYVLSGYYYPLTNWLSPIAGGGLSLMLGMFFIVLGNPLTYPVLIPAWIAIGAVVGISVRRVLGSIVSSIFLFLTCWAIISIGFIGYLFSILPTMTGAATTGSGLGSFSSFSFISAATPPVGSNILTLITEPVIYQIFQDLMANIPALSTTSQGLATTTSPTSAITSLFLKFVAPFIISSVMLFIICTVTASLVAHFVSKLSRARGGGGSMRNSQTMSRVFTILALVLSVILVFSSALPGIAGTNVSPSGTGAYPGPATARNGGLFIDSAVAQISAVRQFALSANSAALAHQPYSVQHGSARNMVSGGYNESALNLISPYGNLYSLYSFDSSNVIPQATINDNNQVSGSYLLMTNNLIDFPFTDILSSALGPGTTNSSQASSSAPVLPSLSSLLTLVPPEVLLVIVNPGPVSAKTVASEQAAYYSGITGDQFTLIYGVTNSTTQNGSSSPSSTGFLSGANIFVYGSNAPAQGSAAHMTGTYLSQLHPDGLISGFSSQLTSGSLFAAPAGGFEASIMIAGYQSGSAFPGNSSSNVSLMPSPLSGSSFFYGLFVKYAFAHGSGQHVIPLSSIAGNKQFSFSPTASNSSFELLYPTAYDAFNLNTTLSQNGGYGGIVYSDNTQLGNFTYNSSGWTYVNVNAGYVFSPGTGLSFSAPFPPDVILNSSESVSGSIVKIAVTLENLGNSTVGGVSVHFPGVYILSSNFSVVKTGSNYTNVSSLAPGQSLNTVFSFAVGNGGLYMLPPIQYSFSDGQHSYFLISGWRDAKVQNPSIFVLFPSYLAKAGYGISSYIHLGLSYNSVLYIIYGVLSLFIFLAIYSQYSSYKKWKKGRRRAPPLRRGTREAPPPQQQAQQKVEYPAPESKDE